MRAPANFSRIAFSALLAAAGLGAGVSPSPAQQISNLREASSVYEKHGLDEVPEKYRKWVVEEVGHIITDDEYDTFLRLDSEAKYENFVEQFWKVRDVTPGTPRNEYKELHYERLAYANEFYGRGTSTPGWKTDRGRMYILLGKPQMVSRVPSDMLTYPLETWFYAADPALGVAPFFYLLFYQRHGGGDYELYSPLSDGPRALFNGAGLREIEDRVQREAARQVIMGGYAPTGFASDPGISAIYDVLREIDIDLASAAISYYPSEAGLEYGITPLRSELLIGAIESIPETVMPDSTWALKVLTGTTESDVRFQTLELQAMAVPLIDIDGEPFLHFAARTDGRGLHMGNYDDKFYFSFSAAGSITDAEKRVLQNFDADLSGDLDEEQARRFNTNPFVYMDMVPTVPGRQVLSVTVENSVARSFGQSEIELVVPSAHPDNIMLVGPVLAGAIQQLPEYDPFTPRFAFQYRNLALVPSVNGEFTQGDPVLVFEQVLLPAEFTGSATVRYELLDVTGAVVREGQEVLGADAADPHGVIAYIWEIDSQGLLPGSYRVRLTVDENASAGASAPVVITAPVENPGRPFINAQSAPPATDVSVALERAEQYRHIGDIEASLRWLAQALEREPDDPDVRALQVELLESSGRYAELIDVLVPRAAENPRDTGLLVRLAAAYAEVGEHYDAIRYYERARIQLGSDSTEILNSLASEYLSEGQADKARQILERSLELDGEQPEIRRMLERISQTTEPAAR